MAIKKLNISDIKNKLSLKKVIKSGIILTMLFYGNTSVYSKSFNEEQTEEKDRLYYINNDQILEEIEEKTGKKNIIRNIIDTKDLRDINELELYELTEKDNLSFINYCDNLDSLVLTGRNIVIKNINKLDNVKKLSISEINIDLGEINFDNNSTTEEIELNCNTIYNVDLLYNLKNLKKLTIYVTSDINIDLSRFKTLDELVLIGGENEIPIYLSNELLKDLRKNGVNVKIKDYGNNSTEYKVKQKSLIIDKVVEELRINNNSTDQEKLDAILNYTISRFEYAPNDYDYDKNMYKDLYKDGYLNAFYNYDFGICGNYSAVFNALANRVGLESYLLENNKHAWNLVKLDGIYYYIDTTNIDGKKTLPTSLSSKYDSIEELFQNATEEEKLKIYGYKIEPSYYEVNTDNKLSPSNMPQSIQEEIKIKKK